MKRININGSDYTIEELTKILEDAKKISPMQKVYEYHNTTEEEFNELYKNLPKHIKANEKEFMIVAFYNKEWKPDFQNSNEKKWYAWFYMDDFRLGDWDYCCSVSSVPARALFKNKADLIEAVEVYFEEFKESRLG